MISPLSIASLCFTYIKPLAMHLHEIDIIAYLVYHCLYLLYLFDESGMRRVRESESSYYMCGNFDVELVTDYRFKSWTLRKCLINGYIDMLQYDAI